ncbi:MAG: DUF1365 domain-containing protein [Halioglobus sp.]|nr:DUF1365 domain-containing protein [Halioglobus sp.]
MKSRLYTGVVRHRRFQPRPHDFDYRVAMPFLNLEEIPELFDRRWLWSRRGRALAEFRRSDYLGDPSVPLIDAVRQRIRESTGATQTGPIYLLANLRYFGYCVNPIACYYCYSEDGEHLDYLVAEVTNTPWEERHSYVLPGPDSGQWLRTEFDKAMHVSPFNPMAMRYHWRSNQPGEHLALHLENHAEGEKVMDATMTLDAQPLTGGSMARLLAFYPFMTARVALAIYWQALRLFLKGVPIHTHPAKPAIGARHE